MYLSDYGYAATCSRSLSLTSYSSCTSNNWLYTDKSEWTIAPVNGWSDNAFYILSDGNISHTSTDSEYITRPTLYLNSNVSILDNGKDGSVSKPYDLVLN